MSNVIAVRAFVSGLVQGVFFRAATVGKAAALGVEGWVRNLPDGRLEVFAQGDQDDVDALMRWLHHGPPAARVVDVREAEETVDQGLRGFVIR